MIRMGWAILVLLMLFCDRRVGQAHPSNMLFVRYRRTLVRRRESQQ